jgi:uncharacterized protein YndB with AHSA1/START domain
MTTTGSDRIEKSVLLKAPRSRVWRALTDAREFGTWFRVSLSGRFEAGKTVFGQITSPGYEHIRVEIAVERIEPETLFAYRWHPYPIDPDVDYSTEPTTLVEFRLEEAGGHTTLTVVESGFERIPASRRAEAFRMNTNGWEGQLRNIQAHVSA